ncbi:hypothetical protein GJT88_00840 [Enterobacteriaceae endosymbiont of Donacia tomentosa]|uniref:peptidylprolyl isomerase n=1 Tax=Enterobacteriaceae endosymbiont of Donacia tomentosa TaxID=2675787 RepID=UPI0014499F29|nr:peptidylprolyl isomerase [Enterobacteriaceae endosymbiont of Donacia tomentosa]QJC31610.1 hypothetical protein GJT88_00840 [Enterobacteriaceae endosymbiont of Donacia tomentosa]
MTIKKIVFLIVMSFSIWNYVFASVKNIDNIAIIIDHDMISKNDICNLFNAFNMNSDKDKYFQQQTINNHIIQDFIKNNIFLQISKNNNIFVSEKNLDDFILNVHKENNISLQDLKDNLIKNNINYDQYRQIMRQNLMIYILKSLINKQKLSVLSEEVNSLAKQLYLKYKKLIKYDISIFYIPINKFSLDNDFNYKLNLLKKLSNILTNKNISSNLRKKQENLWIYEKKIIKVNLRWNDRFPQILINYLNSSKKDDVIGPIYLNSKLYLLKINDTFIKENVKNKKILIRFIFIKKNSLNKKIPLKKIKNIYFNILKKRMSFYKAMNFFSEDNDVIKFKNNIRWTPLEYFNPKFQKIIKKLKINQISLPIEGPDGFYIIQLLGKKDNFPKMSFFKKKAYNLILQANFNKGADNFISEYMNRIYIKNFLSSQTNIYCNNR